MIWFQAIRPKTLVASICPVCIGSVMAFTNGEWDIVVLFCTLATALGIQITGNFVNDYQDFCRGADTPQRKGPLRATASGLVSVPSMQRASFISATLTALAGLYLIWVGGIAVGILLPISLLLTYCYTAGPKPLAYLGLGDLFVLPFYGPVTVGMTYFLQTGTFSSEAWIAGIGPGALATAILVSNNIRDEEEDRLNHKKTLIVRFGNRFGKCEYMVLVLGAVFLPLYFFSSHPFGLIACLSLLPALLNFQTLLTSTDYRSLLPKTARLLLIYTLLFCIGWML